jgi:hypothetical protein
MHGRRLFVSIYPNYPDSDAAAYDMKLAFQGVRAP